MLIIKQKQKVPKIPKRIWMKTWLKTRSDNSACANIILELLLTTNSGIILESMQLHTIDHTLYIHFYTLITYTFYITYNYNSDTAPGAQFRRSRGRCSQNFCKFHRKTPVFESLFYKVANLQAAALLKRDSWTANFLSNLRNSSEHQFWRQSESFIVLQKTSL